MLWGAGFAAAILCSFISFIIQYRFFKLFRPEIFVHLPEESVECGSDIDIRFEINNRIPAVPGCRIDTGLRFIWKGRKIEVFQAYRKGSRSGIYKIKADKRGAYSSKGAFFRFSDAAGFFNIEITAGREEKLSVKPAPVNPENLPHIMSRGGSDLSTNRRKIRSEDLIESRQYYPGDDVRRINWKAWAHIGELFIRQGEELPDPESNLIIVHDFSGSAEENLNSHTAGNYMDYSVAVLAGLIEMLKYSGVKFEFDSALIPGLWWNDTKAGKISDGEKTGILFFCSAFSTEAERYCGAAVKAGRSVSVAVPVISSPSKDIRRSLAEKILFKEGFQSSAFYESQKRGFELIMKEADDLSERLSKIRGLGNVSII